jgi:hypothetical protein
MCPNTFFAVSAALLASETGADERLATRLFILGACLAALALIGVFVPFNLRSVINERLSWEWHSVRLNLSFVELIFLGGLAAIGGAVYVSAPSRLVADFTARLLDLTKDNATLKTELDDANRELKAKSLISITLDFTVPPGVDLSSFQDFNSLKCHYRLSSGGEFSVDAQGGTAIDDIECRIENISPELVIERVNLEQEVQVDGQPKKHKLLGYRENVYPAKPHYRLCPPNESPCK